MAVDYFSFYAMGFPFPLGVSVPQRPSRSRRRSNRASSTVVPDTLPCVVWAPLTTDDVEDIWGPLERGRPKAWEFRWPHMASVVYPYELDRAAYEDTTRYPQQPVVVQFHPLFVEMTLRKLKLADGLLQLGFVSVERGNRRGLFQRAPALAECKYQTLRLKRRKARSGEDDEEEWQSQHSKRPRGPGLSPTPSDTTEALSSASVSDSTDDDDDSAGRRFFEARNRQMQAYLHALLQLPESSNSTDNTSSAYDEVVPTITTTTTAATIDDQEPLIGLPDYCLDLHG